MTGRLAQAVEVAGKLQDARRTIRFLLGDAYDARLAPVRTQLREIAEARSLTLLAAANLWAQRMAEEHEGVGVLIVMAALVDELEAEGGST